MANHISIIGIGPGSSEYITPYAMEMIKNSDILVGGERVLKLFSGLGKQEFVVKNNLQEMKEFIRDRRERSKITVVASGDPAFYGILEFLKRSFGKEILTVIPGISSVQLACARLCISWHDAVFFSAHGRKTEGLVDIVQNHSKVIILTDPENSPALIAKMMLNAGISERKVYICENLAYQDERITGCGLSEVPDDTGMSGCIMVICDE